ncbi:hypothetical protein D3C77_519750 [compost metagenome]
MWPGPIKATVLLQQIAVVLVVAVETAHDQLRQGHRLKRWAVMFPAGETSDAAHRASEAVPVDCVWFRRLSGEFEQQISGNLAGHFPHVRAFSHQRGGDRVERLLLSLAGGQRIGMDI